MAEVHNFPRHARNAPKPGAAPFREGIVTADGRTWAVYAVADARGHSGITARGTDGKTTYYVQVDLTDQTVAILDEGITDEVRALDDATRAMLSADLGEIASAMGAPSGDLHASDYNINPWDYTATKTCGERAVGTVIAAVAATVTGVPSIYACIVGPTPLCYTTLGLTYLNLGTAGLEGVRTVKCLLEKGQAAGP